MAWIMYNRTLFVLLFYNIIQFCCCKNNSLNILLPSRSMQLGFDRDSEELSNQKQYVVRLNAKVLAQERERLEKSLQQNLFNYPNSHRHLSGEYENYFDNPGKTVGSHLRKIANDELCVTTMQAIYDTLPSSKTIDDPQGILTEITIKLNKKMQDYMSVLEKNKQYIESVFSSQKFLFDMTNSACCGVHPDSLSYDEHFGVDISLDKGCVTFPYSHFPTGLYIGKNLSAAFKLHFKKIPSLLWQYFISSDGAHFEYPAYHLGMNGNCEQKTDRHRQIYQDTIKLRTKHVIIVIDQGNSLSLFQFGSAKIIGKHILNLLSPYDKVIVLGLASDIQYVQGNSCMEQKLLYATAETKYEISRFFDNLSRKQNGTNHVLGFQHIFDIIRKIEISNTTSRREILVAYISRGLLSSLVDAKKVLEIIADGNLMSKNHIVINTYALIDDERPVMYEKDFLQDVAEQNYRKYNIHVKKMHIIQKGEMLAVNSTKDISVTIGDIFKAFPNHPSEKPVFSLPYFDPVSKGMVISISRQVFHEDDLVGISGIDISLTDISEDIAYFMNTDHLYAFLVDESGIALSHPSFSHPNFANWHHIPSYIWHLEDKPGFKDIYKSILRERSGRANLSLKTIPNHKKEGLYVDDKVVVYQWRKIEGTPYIVCVVSIEPGKIQKVLKNYISSDETNFSYHRFDLIPTSTSCRHMKQLSSLGITALFLSASCFISPYKYLAEEETRQMVYNYIAYLKDPTKLIANPGLKSGVRNEVLAISQIISSWKTAANHKEFTNYIVRRFIATRNGVFQVYPATLMDKSYDATRRDWYIRALEHPGKIILTAPYLDIGGAGYVITLSHTVYEGKPAALHNSGDNVVAVMGMDFTFGYFYKLLLEKISICKEEQIICFLLDDKGYLVSHPDLIEPAERGPVEQQHITHKEPLVANDLLNHRAFVTKKLCNSYSDRTIQRYYQLNTSLDTILTNLAHGDQCKKYQLMTVHGTNIFLGIVNRTCNGIPAFCPCSMIDRLCLNCHRMEPTECECPCECPLKVDFCTGQLNDSSRYPTCPHFPEQPHLPVVDLNILEALPPCYEHHCSTRKEANECIGILGCEWCQIDSDGITHLSKKFCTEQRRCFGGILGARTPYADEIVESLPEGEFLTLQSTPVGPVAGGFIVFFLVVALGVYCYRNHVLRSSSSHFGSSTPDETNFRMTQLNNEPDEIEPFQEPINSAPVSHLIPHMEHIVVSPYRVPTNYRRPAGGDSDHGYSTMTPHEDSELAPYFEPLLIGKDRHNINPTSQHSLSSGSRTSSPISCVPSTTYSASPSTLKIESPLPTTYLPKTDFPFNVDPRKHGAHVLAHVVQVHSENID